MKVMQVIEATNGRTLQASERPMPVPGPAELLIRVRAAGVITTELQWQPTTHCPDGSLRKHAIPAHEFSGDVAARGEAVKSFQAGQAIYGMNDWYQEGALAEFCIAPASSVPEKPKSLSNEEAATVPISALTAWQALTVQGHLRAPERVLVHGGAGGVGLFAVQLAKSLGAHVIATASAATIPLVESSVPIGFSTIAAPDLTSSFVTSISSSTQLAVRRWRVPGMSSAPADASSQRYPTSPPTLLSA